MQSGTRDGQAPLQGLWYANSWHCALLPSTEMQIQNSPGMRHTCTGREMCSIEICIGHGVCSLLFLQNINPCTQRQNPLAGHTVHWLPWQQREEGLFPSAKDLKICLSCRVVLNSVPPLPRQIHTLTHRLFIVTSAAGCTVGAMLPSYPLWGLQGHLVCM